MEGMREDDRRRRWLAGLQADRLLAEAWQAGLDAEARADGLLAVRGPEGADPLLVRELLARKADLLPLLARLGPDWRDAVEERAAILEYDAGHGRAQAERLGWEMLLEGRS